MKKYYITFFIISLFFIGCVDKNRTIEHQSSGVVEQSEGLNIKRILDNFYPSDLKKYDRLDSNMLVLIKDGRFDTLFTLILIKEDSKIKGFYYEVTPENGQLSEQMDDLLLFEGMRFNVDTLAWNQIIEKGKNLLENPNHEETTGCLDCNTYILINGSKKTISGQNTSSEFKEYSNFVEKKIIRPIRRYKAFEK